MTTRRRGQRKLPTRGTLRSLKVSDAFKSFVLDQLAGLDQVTPRSMFGGVGLYSDGVFFGIIARDELYFKVDARNLADYKRARMKPFQPFDDRPMTMKYFQVPLEVLESPDDLAAWARKSIEAGRGATPRR
jgi:DNA transformation protein and related proteins